MDKLFYVVPALGIVGLLYTFIKFAWVSRQDAGNERMKEISTYIAEGAMAFLKAEYKILTYFVIIGALLLGMDPLLVSSSVPQELAQHLLVHLLPAYALHYTQNQ